MFSRVLNVFSLGFENTFFQTLPCPNSSWWLLPECSFKQCQIKVVYQVPTLKVLKYFQGSLTVQVVCKDGVHLLFVCLCYNFGKFLFEKNLKKKKHNWSFFDIRVFDPNAFRYLHKYLQQCHTMNELKKKRSYNERVLQVEHGTFTPLVFSIYGSMGREYNTFSSRLSQLISDKINLRKSITMNWIKTKVYFALLKASLLCLWGSGMGRRKVSEFECDIDVLHKHAKTWIT